MKTLRYLFTIIVVFIVALAGYPASAMPNFSSASLAQHNASRILVLPDAADHSPVISLGTAIDPASGQEVEGLAFVHYKKANSHKPTHSAARSSGTSCYAFLSNGAKWKTVEPWLMNAANSEGLAVATLFALQDSALSKWEDANDGIVGNGTQVQIFGPGSATSTLLAADQAAPDGKNEVYFGDVSTTGSIAVTIVWGVFSGPTINRQLVEWDQIYDETDFDWSAEAAGVAGKMDFDNVATHEDGHAGGMGHPSDSCTEETMYRFAASGEIKKRDLNSGDIAGINKLY